MWKALATLLLATVCVLVMGAGSGNPFEISGVKYYVNSDFFFEVQASADKEGSTSSWSERAMKFAHVPSAYWLDTMAKVGKLMVMMEEAKNFAAEQSAPVLTSFVIYDVPTRDCYALASNGEIQLATKYKRASGTEEDGLGFYESSYIDPIYSVLKRYDSNSPQLVMVLFIEPDSLPNIVTNAKNRNCSDTVCAAYVTAQKYTIGALGKLKNAWLYMDLAHGGWLGYKDNLPKADGPFKEVLSGQEDLIRGFVTNSANYSPLVFESGWKDLGSKDTDYCMDELTYYGALMGASSLFSGKKVIIDTGRNGVPGCRSEMGNWCNIYDTGIGKLPGLPTKVSLSAQACPDVTTNGQNVREYCKKYAPDGLKALDAVWWIKTPGESDGISENKPGARLDGKCQSKDSWWKDTKGSEAPEAGQWFHEFFRDLIKNAIEVPTSVDLCAPNPCKNLGKCSSGKCTCVGGWKGADCGTPGSDCLVNPCKNYGTCGTGGKCTCATGFSGPTCEETSGACDSKPGNQCFNGGICSSSPWKCQCLEGFSGTMCQEGPRCASSPCKNGGSCFSSPLGNACFCPRGWMGTDCNTKSGATEVADPCKDITCPSHSTCNGGTCACDAGYTAGAGGACTNGTSPEDPCKTATCQKKCTASGGKAVCSCDAGETVQADGSCKGSSTDPCKSITCGGTCTVSNGKATCTCPTGKVLMADGSCATQTSDPCDPNPCEQICKKSGTAAVCSCEDGYKVNPTNKLACVSDSGPSDDACSSEPCNAAGYQECQSTAAGGYACTCLAGYTYSSATTCKKATSTCKCSYKCSSTGACLCPSGLFVDGTSCVPTQPAPASDKGSTSGTSTLLIVLIVLVVLAIVAGLGYFFYQRSRQQQFMKSTQGMGQSTTGGYGYSTQGPPRPAQPYGAPAPQGTQGYYGGNTGGAPRPPPPRM